MSEAEYDELWERLARALWERNNLYNIAYLSDEYRATGRPNRAHMARLTKKRKQCDDLEHQYYIASKSRNMPYAPNL